MKTEAIYLCRDRYSEIDAILNPISDETVPVSTFLEKNSFLEYLNQTVESKDFIVIIGGFYTGPVNLPALFIEEYDLPTARYRTEVHNEFYDENKIILPENGTPLYTDDGVVFGLELSSGDQIMLLLSESLSEGDYSFAQGLSAYLIRKNILPAVPAERDIPEPSSEKAMEAVDVLHNGQTAVMMLKQSVAETEEDTVTVQEEFFANRVTKDIKPKGKLFLILTSVIVLLGIVGTVAGFFILGKPGEADAYDKISKSVYLAYGQADSSAPKDILEKFGTLYRQNKDIMGWITIPDTAINSPVMYTKENDGHFYKNHLFNKKQNQYGTLYFNPTYKANGYNRNTILYGSNYMDKRAFAELTNYLELSFYQKAPVITMDTLYSENKWKIFSVMVTDLNDAEFNAAKDYFFDDAEFNSYLKDVAERTVINTTVDVNSDDELLTLVTDDRLPNRKKSGLSVVISARKVRPLETGYVDTASATHNENALLPETWYELHTDQTKLDAMLEPTQSETNMSTTEPTIGSSTISTTTTTSVTTVTARNTAAVQIPMNDPPEVIVTTTKATTKATTAKPSGKGTTKQPTTTTTAKTTTKTTTKPSATAISVKNQNTGTLVTDEPVKIVAMIIEAEMGSGYHEEALKAQAVATYTYLRYQMSHGTTPSAPMKTAGTRATEAAQATAGMLVKYNGAICDTVYSAMSAGRTANCKDVWGGDLKYLVSVDSSVDKNNSNFDSTRTYKAADVATYVKDEYSVDLKTVSDKTKWFVLTKDANNIYVNSVSLGGLKTVKGIDIRYYLFTSSRVGSANTLRSHAYTVVYNSSADTFTFAVKGYGHGIGLSQVGANYYAGAGWDYVSILKHYYTGVTIG
ncbi:MAG: hypothetical protein BGN88_05190 [Clostridiales bacterium 43-6]|nr:MAG: hypothetical protein BGN88_05190 [Clostridiales bacterium 43-6]